MFDEPTSDQYYLMQIAREVHCVLMKREDRKKVKSSDFRLDFERKRVKRVAKRIEYEEPKEEWVDIGGSDEQRLEEVKQKALESKSTWFALCGMSEKVKWEGG